MLDASREKRSVCCSTLSKRCSDGLTRFGSMYQAMVLCKITRHVTSCASVILLCGRYSIYARRSNFLWKLTFLNCVFGLLVFSLFHVYYCIIFKYFSSVISGHCCSDKEGENNKICIRLYLWLFEKILVLDICRIFI